MVDRAVPQHVAHPGCARLHRASLAAVLAVAAIASVRGSFAVPKPPEVDMKIAIAVPETAVAAGSEGIAVVTMTPPAGIKINKYPPVRLTVEENPPISFKETTVKLGLDAMPDDPEQNRFESLEPIRLAFKVDRHSEDAKIPIKGKLRFTYCVARSGFCAPASRDIQFAVPVAASH